MNLVYLALLHDEMLNKNGETVTTSLTLIDLHDIARSARTYGFAQLFIVHSVPAIRALANRLKDHWQVGFGSTYNLNRKEALDYSCIVEGLDDVIAQVFEQTGKSIKLIATSARGGENRISFPEARELLANDDKNAYIVLFGTGWGMTPALLERCDYILEPIYGYSEYNHLSVRSACAIILDRLRIVNR
jgi:hypothetical protein